MKQLLQALRFLFGIFRAEEFPDPLINSALPGADLLFPDDDEAESTPFLTENMWQYRVLKNGTAEICGWTGSAAVLTIPESVAGYRVDAIGRYAFQGRTALEELRIPAGMDSIGKGAFCGCSRLRKVMLAPGLSVICESAFERCTALEEIRIPDSVVRIEDAAFSGCSALQSVTLEEGLSSLGEGVFSDCSALRSIRLPASLETIDAWLFLNSGIKEVTVHQYSEGETYCRLHWLPYRLAEKPKRLRSRLRGLLNRKRQM